MWSPFRIFSEHGYRWSELDKALTAAFERIKTEKRLTFSWINYFRKKETQNEKNFKNVEYHIGKHQAMIEALEKEILELKNAVKMSKISPFPDQVRTKSGLISGLKTKNSFMTKIVSVIGPQRKEYVIQKILDLVEKEQHTTKQIETVIVKEKSLCGRTAFYDYLKELKYQNLIKHGQRNGRKVLILA